MFKSAFRLAENKTIGEKNHVLVINDVPINMSDSRKPQMDLGKYPKNKEEISNISNKLSFRYYLFQVQ
jgi:hypothetical protein